MCGALALNLVDAGIERANFAAEALLIGDARFEAVEIEGDDVGACGDESAGEGAEEFDALLQELEEVGGVEIGYGVHGSGALIELVLIAFGIEFRVQEIGIYALGRSCSAARVGLGLRLNSLARRGIVGILCVALKRINLRSRRWRKVGHLAARHQGC
jgi:hypothetical protein